MFVGWVKELYIYQCSVQWCFSFRYIWKKKTNARALIIQLRVYDVLAATLHCFWTHNFNTQKLLCLLHVRWILRKKNVLYYKWKWSNPNKKKNHFTYGGSKSYDVLINCALKIIKYFWYESVICVRCVVALRLICCVDTLESACAREMIWFFFSSLCIKV